MIDMRVIITIGEEWSCSLSQETQISLMWERMIGAILNQSWTMLKIPQRPTFGYFSYQIIEERINMEYFERSLIRNYKVSFMSDPSQAT